MNDDGKRCAVCNTTVCGPCSKLPCERCLLEADMREEDQDAIEFARRKRLERHRKRMPRRAMGVFAPEERGNWRPQRPRVRRIVPNPHPRVKPATDMTKDLNQCPLRE